ncbi:MAG TPA: type VI secretion system tube protein Hcp [Verrucomicrobiae bacterium]|jgi:type VI secretion system secreted protein Hcp|nr:type VI secretion system tube protein Hcp [Verrucomicrobiae bacterium]
MFFSKTSVRSILLTVICIALVALPAMAALDGYIIIRGVRSRVIEVKSSIASPRDPQSGMASGKRQHKPLTIVKEVDKASPMYMKAAREHEMLGEVVIEFNRRGQSPEKLTLNNAMITQVRLMPRRGGTGEEEEITFTYQKIEWSLAGGKKSYADDWETTR